MGLITEGASPMSLASSKRADTKRLEKTKFCCFCFLVCFYVVSILLKKKNVFAVFSANVFAGKQEVRRRLESAIIAVRRLMGFLSPVSRKTRANKTSLFLLPGQTYGRTAQRAAPAL